MKRTTLLAFVTCIMAMMSCGECEDKNLEISQNLMEFIPYQVDTSITMINSENEVKNYTITPDIDISTEEDGDCITTFNRPYIFLNTETQDEFMQIWASFNEDLLGDHEQFWFIVHNEDNSIYQSAMMRDPLLFTANVNLNGTNFDDVISIIQDRDENRTVIHMQRNVGLIGYEVFGETWAIQ